MLTLDKSTIEKIRIELESIPEKYQRPFSSVHEGIAVLREEYVELENEIFFGEKKAIFHHEALFHSADANLIWKASIRHEAIQVAAMAVRIIQELT